MPAAIERCYVASLETFCFSRDIPSFILRCWIVVTFWLGESPLIRISLCIRHYCNMDSWLCIIRKWNSYSWCIPSTAQCRNYVDVDHTSTDCLCCMTSMNACRLVFSFVLQLYSNFETYYPSSKQHCSIHKRNCDPIYIHLLIIFVFYGLLNMDSWICIRRKWNMYSWCIPSTAQCRNYVDHASTDCLCSLTLMNAYRLVLSFLLLL